MLVVYHDTGRNRGNKWVKYPFFFYILYLNVKETGEVTKRLRLLKLFL